MYKKRKILRRELNSLRENDSKDLRTLKGTLIYCEDIKSALNRFGRNYEVFANNRVFFHAVSMSLMQVGELANKLSAEFKEKNNGEVDWRRLRLPNNFFSQLRFFRLKMAHQSFIIRLMNL